MILLGIFLLFWGGYIKYYYFDVFNIELFLSKKKSNRRRIRLFCKYLLSINNMLSEIIKDLKFNELGVFGD